jgi:signal transduction histidine kinase
VVNEEGQVTSTVRDDGKGISDGVGEFRPDSIGIGIAGMRQRVKEFAGELRLRNTGSGSVLEAVIPTGSFAPPRQVVSYTVSR